MNMNMKKCPSCGRENPADAKMCCYCGERITARKKCPSCGRDNLLDRSIRIDIEAKDSSDKMYNIEVQNRSDEANVRRARYHSSMIDTRLLKRRQKFSTLVDSYVIAPSDGGHTKYV